MPESIVNFETASKLGLSEDEYNEIQKILGRKPSYSEISVYAILWTGSNGSNNQTGKLENLQRKAAQILEESGVAKNDSIDIGNDLSCEMKLESNYPDLSEEIYDQSASISINLYRNLLSKNAKPVSCINNFLFGHIKTDKTKQNIIDLVNGNSRYNNAFGAPLTGMQARFDEAYDNKPLLNSLLIGVKSKMDNDQFLQIKENTKLFAVISEAEGRLNSPIYEKLVLDTTYQAFNDNLILAAQSLSDINIPQFCIHLFSKTEMGIHIDLGKLSNYFKGEDFEKLLSSVSAASILMVCLPNAENELVNTFKSVRLDCIEIGKTIKKRNLVLELGNKIIVDLPFISLENRLIPGEEIIHDQIRDQKKSDFNIDQIPIQKNLREIAWFLIKHPNIASKKWIFEQYDSMVGVNNMTTNFPSSASLINIKETNKAIAVSLESHPMYSLENQESGIQIIVSEASRKIVCTGAKPLAATAGFSFPDKDIFSDYKYFTAIVKALAKAGKKLKTSIKLEKINISSFVHKDNIPGNNCFLPVIGMVGILGDKNHHMTISFKNKGNIIFLLGQSKEDISSSEYLYSYHKVKKSPAPWFNLDMEYKIQSAVQELIKKNYVCSAHSVSKGGLFIALVESAMRFGLGFDIITDTDIRTDAFLFGESQGRILVSITPNKEDHFIDFMVKKEIPFLALGHVTKGEMRIDDISFGFIEDAKREYKNALGKIMNH